MLRNGIAQFVGSWVSESGYHLRIKKVDKDRALVDFLDPRAAPVPDPSGWGIGRRATARWGPTIGHGVNPCPIETLGLQTGDNSLTLPNCDSPTIACQAGQRRFRTQSFRLMIRPSFCC